MRIDSPEVVLSDTDITLQARVRCEQSSRAFPDRLWFRFPRQWEPYVDRGIAPFVVALSSLASVLREPIHAEGPIAERLEAGLEEYWTIFHQWFPQRFSPVSFHCSGYEEAASPGRACGTAFSGGVDSFYTLFRHMDGHEARPTHVIRVALFVHGFDIPLSDPRTYTVAADAYEPALEACGVRVVRAATNLRDFVDLAGWHLCHGSALCGTALALSPGLKRFYVPSSKTYTTLEPWGSDPLIDGLLSTDQFQVIHDGAGCTRFEKLQAMQDWPPIRSLLRSCYKKLDGLRNCGHCGKCRQTMLVLASLGVLKDFDTFPVRTSPAALRWARFETPHQRVVARQSIDYAKAHGRHAVAWAGRIAMRLSQVKIARRKARTAWSRVWPGRAR